MSKTIGSPLKTHLAQAVTTLATCWRIVRIFDSAIFAFTSFDADLVVSGVTYKSTAGFSGTAIQTGSQGAVDNMEVVGFFDTDGITERDLKNGLFNYATIYVFLANWADLTQGILRLRRGWLGETTRAPNGAFMAELRGLTQGLTQEFSNVMSPLCRNDLGDHFCKVPIRPDNWLPSHAYTAGAVGDNAQYVLPVIQPTDLLKTSIFLCTQGGTSLSTEPVWDTTVGNTTNDNDVIWTCVAPYRQIGTVVTPETAHTFIASVLSYPAGDAPSNVATISFRNNVSAGTALSFSDGINTVGWTIDYDLRGSGDAGNQDAVHYVATAIEDSTLDWTVVLSGSNLTITNTSGAQSTISKTGDTLGAIVIGGFSIPALDGGTLTWISGDNVGVSTEIKTYNTTTSEIVLWLGASFAPQVGDRFFYTPGCDKRRDTCWNKFRNILNNRSEPDMPGNDKMLGYPDAPS